MLGLDVTTNEDYEDSKSGAEFIYGIKALQVYSYEISYNTLVDEKFTGNEQRRPKWSLPRRKWTLEFQKNHSDGVKFEDFFKEVMGRYKTWKFKWSSTYEGMNMGGNELWYNVRFDSDSLKVNIDYLGYRHFTIDVIEVRTP